MQSGHKTGTSKIPLPTIFSNRIRLETLSKNEIAMRKLYETHKNRSWKVESSFFFFLWTWSCGNRIQLGLDTTYEQVKWNRNKWANPKTYQVRRNYWFLQKYSFNKRMYPDFKIFATCISNFYVQDHNATNFSQQTGRA